MKSAHIIRAAFFKTDLNSDVRNIGLDNLRAFCVFGFFLVHTNNILTNYLPVFRFVLPISTLAQEVFFALSGFLIGNQILKLADKQFTPATLFTFYKSRWSRTLPFYFFFVLINFCVYVLIYKNSGINFLTADFKVEEYFLMIQNFCKSHPYFYPEIWPIPIEEWSYLLLPLPVIATHILFKKGNTKHIITFLFALITVISCYRIFYVLNNHPELDWHLRKIVIYRLDALLYGFVMAIAMKERETYFKNLKNALALIGLLLGLVVCYAAFKFSNVCINAALFTVVPFLSSLLLPYFKYTVFKNNNINKLLTHFSLIGYALLLSHLYLIQFLFICFFKPDSLMQTILVMMVYTITVIIFATVFYNRIERPVRLFFRNKK